MEFPTGFYHNNEQNLEGLTFNGILAKDDEWLESNHNWVQWIFPLDEPSAFNKNAPLLTTDNDILDYPIDKLGLALKRMYDFYKFKSKNVSQTEWWITKNNHNFLRLTRILKHLSILRYVLTDYPERGYDIEIIISQQLYIFNFLCRFYIAHSDIITLNTYNYWYGAIDMERMSIYIEDPWRFP